MKNVIQIHPNDNVAIALRDLAPNDAAMDVMASEKISAGHKIALRAIETGEPIVRYGNRIGIATRAIAPGEWVHTHNVSVGETTREYTWNIVANQAPSPAHDTFLGYRRADGRVGTRNYVAIISTVNCSSNVVLQIAHAFTPERLAQFPNVDGVIPIVYGYGCMPQSGTPATYLTRTLMNVAHNPNIGAYVYVGLGCEALAVDEFCGDDCIAPRVPLEQINASNVGMTIQETGGFRKTVAAGIAAVERLLPRANAFTRTPQPISELTVALQCGGSDGWSGVTANPLLGMVVDKIVEQGGAAVLCETPEIFGAEHLLTQRVVSDEVGRKLVARFEWWNAHTKLLGFSVDNNPSPGNKRGGLTTIFEKSLGAAAKGGSTPLTDVYEYAERVTSRGLTFMDTPGNDPVSATGQLAGGCNLIVFTTGRGSVFGSNLAPCVKVASNNALYARQRDDMDFNAGAILDGVPMAQAAEELFRIVLDAASGKRTCNEENGLPDAEFVPWHLGATV
jgi:altronate hydrolase